MSARTRTAADATRSTMSSMRDKADETYEAVQSGVSSMREKAIDTYEAAYDTAANAYETASDRASRAANTVVDSIRSFGRGTAGTGHSLAEFCREQPLVVAGIGLAVGAALGAALPATDAERRLMGEASDDAKRKMRAIASDAIDKAQHVGERAFDAAGAAAFEEAEAQGLTEPLEAGSEDPVLDQGASPGRGVVRDWTAPTTDDDADRVAGAPETSSNRSA
jgi:hypothetical protein